MQTAGVVLVFPSAALKNFAAHATLQVIQPQATGDECPQFLAYPPLVPPTSQIEQTSEVDLANGVATKALTQIPVGRQTLLMSVSDKTNTVILHGCITTTVTAGGSVTITLQPIVPSMPDMSKPDMTMPDMATSPADMAMHKYLSITAYELRSPTRMLAGATVTITDSAATTNSATGMTDSTGVVKLDTVGMTQPLVISATASGAMGYTGAVTLSGVAPTFPSETIAMQLPIELDPPAAAGAATDTAMIGTTANGEVYSAFWLNTFGLASDLTATAGSYAGIASATAAGTSVSVPSLPLASGSYRFAAARNSGAAGTSLTSAATQPFVIGIGQTFMTDTAAGANKLQPFGSTVTLTITKSANVTAYNGTHTYGALLVLPAAPTQAGIPIVPESTAVPGATATVTAPIMPSAIEPGSSVTMGLIETGTSATAPQAVRGEIRSQFASFNATDTASIGPPLDPPTVALAPGATFAHTAAVTVTATPPGLFPLGMAFLHVHIHEATNPKFHWHAIAAASSPTVIVLPANVIGAATATLVMDVSFVEDFSLTDGTVAATLTDDYSKLIRLIPRHLSQSTTNLTVN